MGDPLDTTPAATGACLGNSAPPAGPQPDAAPQGRAFDVAFLLDYKLQKSFSVLAGYRMVEGGADKDKVYNFAWLHYATVGLRGDF